MVESCIHESFYSQWSSGVTPSTDFRRSPPSSDLTEIGLVCFSALDPSSRGGLSFFSHDRTDHDGPSDWRIFEHFTCHPSREPQEFLLFTFSLHVDPILISISSPSTPGIIRLTSARVHGLEHSTQLPACARRAIVHEVDSV